MRTAPVAACIAVAALSAAGSARADIQLNLYGDINGTVQTTGTRSGTTDGFSAAKLDVFTTTTLGRWSFLSETMFEAGDDNAFELDVERVEVGYLYRNWLRIFVGRFHTALGYYNDAFHHGTYFMVPVGRPTMVEFEDGGGLIPAHNIGIHADGRFAIGDGNVRYDLELANGRSRDLLQIENNHDTNRAKAVNLRLRYEPGGAAEGLVVGGNIYFDSISAGTMDTGAGGPPLGGIREWIIGAHAAYLERGLHLIAEVIAVQHSELSGGARHRTYAGFVEAGRAFDDVTPYVRYEVTRFPDEGDPYYAKASGDGYQAATLGVKHSTSENVALKAQGSALFPRATGADTIFTVTGQVAFAF